MLVVVLGHCGMLSFATGSDESRERKVFPSCKKGTIVPFRSGNKWKQQTNKKKHAPQDVVTLLYRFQSYPRSSSSWCKKKNVGFILPCINVIHARAVEVNLEWFLLVRAEWNSLFLTRLLIHRQGKDRSLFCRHEPRPRVVGAFFFEHCEGWWVGNVNKWRSTSSREQFHHDMKR